MITAYGRWGLKKIVLTTLLLALCVQFMFFITISFYRQSGINMPDSAVCECQVIEDLRNMVVKTGLGERRLERESAHEISEHVGGKRSKKTRTLIRKLSAKPKVALTMTPSLGRPFGSQSTVKIATIKSDAITAKTNEFFSGNKVGILQVNMALSTIKYTSTSEENRTPSTPSTEDQPTITEESTPEQKLSQFRNGNASSKRRVQKLNVVEQAEAKGLTYLKEATVKVLSSTKFVRAPLTVQNVQSPATKRMVPHPTAKIRLNYRNVKLPTVKAPTSLRKIPSKLPSSVLNVTNLLTAKKQSPPSTVAKTPRLFEKSLPTARKLALRTTKHLPTLTATYTIKDVPPTAEQMIQKRAATSKMQTITQTTPNNTKSKRKRITIGNTSDFSWKTLTKNLSIFSSYRDTRYLKTTPYEIYQNSLVIFGYELGKLENSLWCVVIMDDNKRLLVKQSPVRIKLAESWIRMSSKYRAMMYRCNLTMTASPRYVTLIDSTRKNEVNSIPLTAFIPVVDPHSPVLHDFGVCYETPLYGNKYDQGIMDSIEMNKILGATWFTIYVYEAQDKALEILQYYSNKLKILDAVMNWGHNIPSPVYNRGLLAGVNDCVYRNMYKVRYLVLCDLDELILPVKGLNWHDIMLEIDRSYRAYFCFRHLGFHKNQSQAVESLACPGKTNFTYKIPRFFATHNRSVEVISGNRQVKSIAKPRYSIVVHVHYARLMLQGYNQYSVPTDLALMKHFRDKDDPRYMNYTSTLDYSMDSFKPAIFAAIEEHYCKNIKHVER